MFWSEPNKIFNATLKKMEPRLAEERYVGHIDINCIVNSNGIYPLEFTARFGYPTISIQQEGLLTPIGEMLYKLAEGTITRLRTRTRLPGRACASWCRPSRSATRRRSRAAPRTR